MPKRAIIPKNMTSIYKDWKMAPGMEIEGLVYLTGFNGTDIDGTTSIVSETQIRTAFNQVFSVLTEAGLHAGHIIEVTSYHVGLQEHLELFKAIWAEYMVEPYPAWTAIEVAGFVSPGVIVELRVVAHRNAAN